MREKRQTPLVGRRVVLFSVGFAPELLSELDRLAGERQTTRTQLIRQFVASGIERERTVERIAKAVEVAV